MNTSKLEALLEQLIDKQDELIQRIESLEETLKEQLIEANENLFEVQCYSSQICDELNWWSDAPSFAKELLSAMSE